jgi:hypothetical protein
MASVIVLVLMSPIAASSHPAPVIIDLVWKHIGGKSRFEKARYVEFTWAHESGGDIDRTRKHVWDRYEGDYVVEFADAKTSDEYRVYFNIFDKQGVALRNGSPVGDDENTELVDRAYRIFCNDTYWLLLPAKLQDPGARLQFVGHAGKPVRAHQDGEFVVLHLFFKEGVGLTPGDEYWLYVRHSGEIAKWRYVLEDGHEGEWEWTEEKDCGMGLLFSTRKASVNGDDAIVFPEVRFSETMDRSVFEYTPDN